MANLYLGYDIKDKDQFNVHDLISQIKEEGLFDLIFTSEDLFEDESSSNDDYWMQQSDFCIFLCSKNTSNCARLCDDVYQAFYEGKKIIPIYNSFENIFPLIRHIEGIKIERNESCVNKVVKKLNKLIERGM